ncbi:hypothetical protein JOQ06_011607, partial [Pogonophryne albipinna]
PLSVSLGSNSQARPPSTTLPSLPAITSPLFIGPACVVTLDTPCVAASMTLGDKHLKPARSRLDGVLDGGPSLAPGPPQDFTPPHSPLSLQRFHSFSGGDGRESRLNCLLWAKLLKFTLTCWRICESELSGSSAPIQRQSAAFLRRQGKVAECWL